MREPILITAPAAFPVSIGEARDQIGLVHQDDDEWLSARIVAGTAAAEEYCWSRFVTQTWKQYFDDFAEPMLLRNPPLVSVSSITYVDAAGATQTLAASVYETADADGIGIVRPKYGQTWPVVRGHYDDVCVTFVCGYGAASAVPQGIKDAILLYVSHFYEHRREGDLRVPRAFYDLLQPYSFRRSLAVGGAQ